MLAVPKRIIPVASGKGGVGKTTFAINFALALSRRASTVLVDLDTGTSSVRSTLNTPVHRDLYHFYRKGARLADCVTPLDRALDTEGEFRNFGFVAGPRHFIAELAQPDAAFRRRVAAEINSLDVDYVVVDLRAGLDENVLDFLPYTNSGVLVFTPHHPTATLAASDIVKAILFRTLRLIFAPGSAVFSLPGMADSHDLIKELLEVTEDVYDESIPNLDALLKDMRDVFGPQPLLDVIADVLEDFRVHYVLNMFNGVQEGYERTLKPFVENVAQNVSTRPTLTQLGWVVDDERIHQANCSGRPILLERRHARKRVRRRARPGDGRARGVGLVDARHRAPAEAGGAGGGGAAAVAQRDARCRRAARRPALVAQGDVLGPFAGHRPGELLLSGVPRPEPHRAAARAQRVRADGARPAGPDPALVHPPSGRLSAALPPPESALGPRRNSLV